MSLNTASALASTATSIDSDKCTQCNAAAPALRSCARCKVVKYCNRECQAGNWPTHKRDCRRLAGLHQPGPMNGSQSTAQNGQTPFRPGAQVVDSQPFTAIRDGTFLHNRTEEKTFQLLIDCLRLAQEDFYKFSSVNLEGSIFAGSSSSEPAFRTFIASAKSCPNLLPPWWTDAKLEECIQYPRREQEDKRNKNFDLRYAQEKSDIQETYGDNSMPMKLRMLAEKIYGHPPSGQPGASMLNIQASMETGSRQGWASTTIDMQHVV